MARIGWGTLVLGAAVTAGGCATEHRVTRSSAMTTTTTTREVAAEGDQFRDVYAATVQQVIGAWRVPVRDLAQQLIAKYGQPDEATPMRLLWHQRPPWKRLELLHLAIPHRFPAPHEDVLLQVVDDAVPPEMADELLTYNGSLLIDRTRGELGARSESEAINILMLNLAHEIVTRARTPQDARTMHAQAVQQGQHDAYKLALRFAPTLAPTADLDQEVVPMPPPSMGATLPAPLTSGPVATPAVTGSASIGAAASPAAAAPTRPPVIAPSIAPMAPLPGASIPATTPDRLGGAPEDAPPPSDQRRL
jgi:hypothetical protein